MRKALAITLLVISLINLSLELACMRNAADTNN